MGSLVLEVFLSNPYVIDMLHHNWALDPLAAYVLISAPKAVGNPVRRATQLALLEIER